MRVFLSAKQSKQKTNINQIGVYEKKTTHAVFGRDYADDANVCSANHGYW